MDGTAEPQVSAPPGAAADGASALAAALGVPSAVAESLVRAGHTTPAAVAALSDAQLIDAGVPAADLERLRAAARGPSADSQRIVEKWVGTLRRPDRERRRRVAPPPKESTDVLRRWVGGDDRAMENWIHEAEERRPAAPAAPPAPSEPSVPAAPPAPPTPASADAAVAPVLEREETVVRWLTGLLDRVKSDQFDPAAFIQETQELHRQLFDERSRRKQLEDEVEHVKRGSIAVIKYVRSREAKERENVLRTKEDEIAELKLRLLALEGAGSRPAAAPATGPDGETPAPPPRAAADAAEKVAREVDARLREEFATREQEYVERETDLRRRIVQLEGEVRSLRGETERAKERAELLAGGATPTVSDELAHRLGELDSREKDLLARENALRARFEEIRIQTDEIERRRSPLEFKERELGVYEQQLATRKTALDLEARRLETLRQEIAAAGGTGSSDEARRLEDLRHQMTQKEQELRARESALRERMVELEKLAGKAAQAEADQMHGDAVADVQEVKVKSGVRRLDDLVFGGFPTGAQILVNGPAHTGKDTLARIFSAEGLKLGIPSIWVVTDRTWGQVKEDLAALFPGYAEAEKAGMIRYVDLYSRSVGSTQSGPGVRLLSSTDKGILEQLATTVNGFSEELKARHPTYRLVFESVSTVTAYLDTTATFRFLQPFVGRRKIDGAAAYYMLDTGMHAEADLETLEHMVDGSINLKVDQMKTFLSVRGIGEAQSRAWIGYTFTKRSLNLGSFSLDHIR